MDITGYMPIIYDAALVVIILAAAVVCWRSGFISSLLRFIGWVAALAAAAIFSKPASQWAYDSFLKTKIISHVGENIDAGISGLTAGSAQMAENLSALRESVAETIEGLLAKLGIETELFAGAASDSAGTALEGIASGGAATEAIAQAAIEPVVVTVVQILFFIVIFAVVLLLLDLLAKLFKGVNRVPVIGGVNKLLGGALGIGQGLIIAYLAVLALVFLSGISNGEWSWLNAGILRDTVVTRWFMELKLPA